MTPRTRRAIALIDVRCMFVSAERLVDPTLVGQPVIVLSNNDGNAVSRSDEAKTLGVKMGQPWFEIRKDPALAAVIARSSNYELYGDLSCRLYDTIRTLTPDLEVYSVDEVFARLGGGPWGYGAGSATAHAAAIQERVRTWTGLPTAAGIGTTKTLAKVAQREAKAAGESLLDISEWARRDIDDLLAATPTSEIWGVGSRLTRGLAGLGIHTALDLARADPGVIRRRWSVVLERTVRELSGVPCIPLHADPGDRLGDVLGDGTANSGRHRQQIMYGRMLGTPVTTRDEVRAVLTQYAQRAATRLRTHGLEASLMQVWVSSSRFRTVEQGGQQHQAISVPLDPPTSEPLTLIHGAWRLLDRIEWRAGAEGSGPRTAWNRAGILLTGLGRAGVQPVLWESEPGTVPVERGGFIPEAAVGNRPSVPPGSRAGRETLAATMDALRDRHGSKVLGWGQAGLRAAPSWDMRREHLSPAATTRWDELLTCR